MENKEHILEIRNLDISFRTTAGSVHAIRSLDLDLKKGETAAIVGESGSGKSVTAKAVMGILASNASVNSGTVNFSYHHIDGTPAEVDILKQNRKWIRSGQKARCLPIPGSRLKAWGSVMRKVSRGC